MLRLLFEKKGDSVWISHLDLMRVFQRAFRRAELMVKHSQGYTPRAVVSIALPLSVGVQSSCELLDFELEGNVPTCDVICDRLNRFLPSGIRVLQVYYAQRKIKELTHLRADLILEYDNGLPADFIGQMDCLLRREEIIVEKHSRKGKSETDIRPLLADYNISVPNNTTAVLNLLVCAQNPALNPQLIVDAIDKYCPSLMPDFSSTVRVEIYDGSGNIFR